MITIWLVLIFMLGVGATVQTAVNSRLRQYVISPIVSAFVSFTVGVVFLALVLLLGGHSLAMPQGIFQAVPWWAWLGGVVGVVGLTAGIILFPKLGSVQTAVMPMLGQITMGVVIDTFGWLDSPKFPLTWLRIVGVCLVVAGALLVMMKKQENKENRKGLLGWQLLGVISGAAIAMQPSMNSCLSAQLGSPIHAAFISFAVSEIVLIIALLVRRQDRIHLADIKGKGRPWWIWTGGILGGTFVAGFAYFAPLVGIALLLIVSIFGMLSTSVAIDKFGLLGAKRLPVDVAKYVGLALVLLGIIAVQH